MNSNVIMILPLTHKPREEDYSSTLSDARFSYKNILLFLFLKSKKSTGIRVVRKLMLLL